VDTRKHLHTFGMLDPVQVTQAAKYLSTVYVSGWQCSSTASTSNEPGAGRLHLQGPPSCFRAPSFRAPSLRAPSLTPG